MSRMTRTQIRKNRVIELFDSGRTRPEIVGIIAQEEGIKHSTAKTFVYSLLSGKQYSIQETLSRVREEKTIDAFTY